MPPPMGLLPGKIPGPTLGNDDVSSGLGKASGGGNAGFLKCRFGGQILLPKARIKPDSGEGVVFIAIKMHEQG